MLIFKMQSGTAVAEITKQNGVLKVDADEFFTALRNRYKERVRYLPTDNQSVIETLKILGENNG